MQAIPLSEGIPESQTLTKRDQQAERAILWGDSQMTSQQKKISKEMDLYLFNTQELEVSCSPLSWWKMNFKHYPRLAQLAKKFLSIQATSAPAERIFSLAGLIVTDRRTRLDPEHVEQIIFLNHNSIHL